MSEAEKPALEETREEDSAVEARRDALKKIGVFGAYASPSLLLLLKGKPAPSASGPAPQF